MKMLKPNLRIVNEMIMRQNDIKVFPLTIAKAYIEELENKQ